MKPREIASLIYKIMDEKSGMDIDALYVTNKTVLADYFVICTCGSEPHIKAVLGEIEVRMKAAGEMPRIEGRGGNSWVLMDFGSVIAHLFLKEARAFYSLERIWADAVRLTPEELLLPESKD